MNENYLELALEKHNNLKNTFWNNISDDKKYINRYKKYYHRLIFHYYKLIIPEGSRVLELGCGLGDLLYSLKPSYGVGIDFSEKMIEKAKKRYPEIDFYIYDAQKVKIEEKFDYIIISDLLNDIFDVQLLFQNLKKCCSNTTRIIINFYSHFWELPLKIASILKLRYNYLEQNWLTIDDVRNILNLESYEVVNISLKCFSPFIFQ